jgi:hypothetical protein
VPQLVRDSKKGLLVLHADYDKQFSIRGIGKGDSRSAAHSAAGAFTPAQLTKVCVACSV